MQRIETDHANINSTSQFQSIVVFGATVEALQLDETQTYSLNGGNQISFDSSVNTNGTYPKGVNTTFGNSTGAILNNAIMAYPYRAVRAWDGNNESENIVQIYPTYGLYPGRWVWRAYALD